MISLTSILLFLLKAALFMILGYGAYKGKKIIAAYMRRFYK